MIQQPARRAPHQGTPFQHHAPNAALLIDFDNVTMGIRSDLGKELKSLLNSDVIRGKVAVQRAYADWRRYPQYIVPLAESSIDLIFAPAYGSSKKNATDLRMAIDAIELVFTRPEIGTYILMTGDSDFSSCVLKLKEYGKYVIGVGMRESSSDLLIQNCDEYYSYHALSGLTRADEVLESREDPWVLVKRAVQQMAAGGDVMRTDRLKQVMLDLDPAFDEKEIGYNKFSRFVHEAANKGAIRLRKGENGQYEIVVDEGEEAPRAAAERRPREAAESPDGRRDRDRDRGRGRGRGRDREEPRREAPAAAPQAEAAPEAAPAPQPEPKAAAAAAPATAPAAQAGPVDSLEGAYGLLQLAVQQLGGKSVRDGDVKRRMLDLAPGFDETTLGFSKFTRFLRQAHDAEVIDLQRANGGNYEVSLSAGAKRYAAPVAAAAPEARRPQAEAPAAAPVPAEEEAQAPAPTPTPERAAPAAAETRAPRAGLGAVRGRKAGRGAAPEGPPPILPGQTVQLSKVTPPAEAAAKAEAEALAETAAPAAEAAAAEETPAKKSRRGRGRRGRTKAETAAAAEAETVAETPAEEAAPAPEAAPAAEAEASKAGVTARSRRGRRSGREAPEGPPPILPGQTVTAPVAAPAAPAEAPPAKKAAAEAPVKKRSRTRARGGRKTAAEKRAQEAAAEPQFSAAELGLPRDRDSIQAYLINSYKGVGTKTAESLLDAFGDDVFRVLQEEPARVGEVLGDRRAGTVMENWTADLERRQEAAQPSPGEATPEPAAEAEAPTKKRARRGGRGRGGRKRTEPAGS
jgi:uncharacterized protein (TIGR00288 family)